MDWQRSGKGQRGAGTKSEQANGAKDQRSVVAGFCHMHKGESGVSWAAFGCGMCDKNGESRRWGRWLDYAGGML